MRPFQRQTLVPKSIVPRCLVFVQVALQLGCQKSKDVQSIRRGHDNARRVGIMEEVEWIRYIVLIGIPNL